MTNIYGYTITWISAFLVFTLISLFGLMVTLFLICFLFLTMPTMATVLIMARLSVVLGFILASSFVFSPEGRDCAEHFKTTSPKDKE